MTKLLAQQEAEEKFRKIGWKLIGRYVGANKKTQFECPLCQKIFYVTPGAITQGNNKSCGCYNIQVTKERNYKGGKYVTGAEFCYYKNNAKSRNLEFSITIQDIEEVYEKQNFKCALSGIDVVFNTTQTNGPGEKYKNGRLKPFKGNASIDRRDNTKGYVKNNIQIVDKYVNEAKWDRTEKDFIEMCCKVADFSRIL